MSTDAYGMHGGGLRLYRPEANDDGVGGEGPISGRTTLGQFFERAFVPLWVMSRGLDPKTETSYRDSIEWWTRLMGDLPMDEIDDFAAARFVQQLQEQRGRGQTRDRMAARTVRRHCRHVTKVLAFAGPKGRDRFSRLNRGLLRDPPLIEGPTPDQPAPSGDWTIEELHRVYEACATLKRPVLDYATPCDWWRALVVVGYYTGLRRGHLLSLLWEDLVVPWQNGGRLTARPRSGKRRKGFRKYVPATALEHLERIKPSPATGLIFAWPGWPARPWTIDKQMQNLVSAAGLGGGRDKFQALRKTHVTQMVIIDPEQSTRIAQQSAGHSDLATTLGHYVNTQAVEYVVARSVEAMPSPVPPEILNPDKQLRLF